MAAQDKSSVVINSETREFAGSLPAPQIDLLPLGLPGNPRYFKSETHVAATGAHENCQIDNGAGVVVELKVQSSKPAALLLTNQRDEMKLNDH